MFFSYCAVFCNLEYGENARQLAEKEFSHDRLATQFVDWLENVHEK